MSKSTNSGIGVSGVITIVFIILKCVNVIDWPLWDFNPFAGSVLIILVWDFWILLAIGVVFAAYKIANSFGGKEKS